MAFKFKQGGGGDYELPPAGPHMAMITRIVDLGTQENNYNGDVKIEHKVRFTYTLIKSVTAKDPNINHSISKNYTASTNEKSNLRKYSQQWSGRVFRTDAELVEYLGEAFENIPGTLGVVSIAHKRNQEGTRTYAEITSLMPLLTDTVVPNGLEKFEQSVLILTPEDFSNDLFWTLPRYTREDIMKSPEWLELQTAGIATDYDPNAQEEPAQQRLAPPPQRVAPAQQRVAQAPQQAADDFPDEPANMLSEEVDPEAGEVIEHEEAAEEMPPPPPAAPQRVAQAPQRTAAPAAQQRPAQAQQQRVAPAAQPPQRVAQTAPQRVVSTAPPRMVPKSGAPVRH
jgi:hypothetical protein